MSTFLAEACAFTIADTLFYSYIKTRSEQETNQMKQYHKQQEEIAHIKKFIASVSGFW